MFEKIPETWIPVLKNAVAALIVFIVVLVLYILAVRALKLAGKRKKLAPSVVSVGKILLRWIFYTFTVVFVLGEFGILENVWAAILAVLAMVAVGFVAVWSVLSNTLCTLLILIYKPFSIGDTIEIPSDNIKGKVIDLNLLFTILREESGALIQLPNNFFLQKASRRVLGEKTMDVVEQLTKLEPTE
jgi:small-conductance mechanosensitive channel